MDRPNFKYSPNAYDIAFEDLDGVCACCDESRSLKYRGPFYCSGDEPDYICPWCIADGRAAAKFGGSFGAFTGWMDIEGVSPDPNDPPPAIPRELLLNITDRTPGYFSWQQSVWLTHCNEPCAFLGKTDREALEPILDEIRPDIERTYTRDPDWVLEHLTEDGMIAGCLFKCVHCGRHRLHVDMG
ncbi:uncharacterized protein CbrC (UPF0167 family) [Mycobacterium frederiksbergense]|uniref:Uncharacterized protein CbrC (UPF0167 family) n=1 Tax=Mycolicibacterium frederiksbergense TaxID=117567 RepID=A0ABT6L0A7_9MYCO|nr:CbrC family protein [Mycolicibacterium frederiksbergense]MDH6195470.1 uncharacterized protein CbrC (UPF0167 family) [Mycolicibacterium frederiksbergense]